MWTFIVTFVLLTAGHKAEEYDNVLRGLIHRLCPAEHAVSQIKSVYDSTMKDRRWRFECTPFRETTDCFWAGYYNLNEHEANFNCPANHVITGFYSTYQPSEEDRTWAIRCCKVPNYVTYECQETPKVNYLGEDFDWHVPGDNVPTGFYTHEGDDNGDHRFRFSYCRGREQVDQISSSNILAANEPIIRNVIEGDIAVNQERNAAICNGCKWPKPSGTVEVPYVISGSYSSSERNTINDAIDGFHSSTCVRFVPRRGQADYISIIKDTGCWSYVGKIGGEQQLSLGRGCVYNGIVQHELLHALSFWHEQSRTDRDDYVRINYENILEDQVHNFNKHQTNNLNIQYDYSSVMHYGPKDFSKNSQDTITPLDPDAQIGQRVAMSTNDILKLNKLYDCEDYLPTNNQWENARRTNFWTRCLYGQAISSITSEDYNAGRRVNDRLWKVTCKPFRPRRSCSWTRYVHRWEQDMDFTCGNNRVIAGYHSRRSNRKQDRKWRFLCCRSPGFTTTNCKSTPVINYWDEAFSWPVPGGNFLTGLKSTFDRTTRDRRWSFTYCQGS